MISLIFSILPPENQYLRIFTKKATGHTPSCGDVYNPRAFQPSSSLSRSAKMRMEWPRWLMTSFSSPGMLPKHRPSGM